MAALTWADDPLVRLEIAITPALSAPIEILLKCGLGQGAREFRGDLAALQTAHDMLSEKAPEMMNAKLTKRSTEELERISKQIFFVAINATVEAARLGDQGAALGHIGQEIRALSKSAQDMIEKMRTEH